MAIEYIEVSALKPHPKNPRLFIRQDVINEIIAGLADGFDELYALLVRPLADGYFQVISGHHRLQAAKAVGLESVPCWVREMDEAEAHMGLAKCNAQGELSALEFGLHVLEVVSMAQGKKSQGLTTHPTEKPVSVLKKIIDALTDEGDMVFDPFAGNGATLVAALKLGRDCMGAELDGNYFIQAQARMIATVGGDISADNLKIAEARVCNFVLEAAA